MAAKSVRVVKAMILAAADMLRDYKDEEITAIITRNPICDHDWGADGRASHCTKCGVSFIAHISEEYS